MAARQLTRYPLAIMVVLASWDMKPFQKVKPVQTSVLMQVPKKGEGALRIRHGHQVGQEGHLYGRLLEQQPWMPVEGPFLFEEHRIELGRTAQHGGQAQIEWTDADPDHVIDALIR
jgi:hypothetical protein